METIMANEEEKVDALQSMFHALDIKVERILTLMGERVKRDDDSETRLRHVETQTIENSNALRIIKWVGGVAFALAMIVAGCMVQLGLGTLQKLAGLLGKS